MSYCGLHFNIRDGKVMIYMRSFILLYRTDGDVTFPDGIDVFIYWVLVDRGSKHKFHFELKLVEKLFPMVN